MIFSLDCETTGLNVWDGDRPFMVTICFEKLKTECFEWPVDPMTREVAPAKNDVKYIQAILANPENEVVMHNAKFDVRMLESIGVKVHCKVHDTMFAVHVFMSNAKLGLKDLALEYLDIPIDDELDLKKAVREARRIAKVMGWNVGGDTQADYWLPRAVALKAKGPAQWKDLCARYGTLDAKRTMLLWKGFQEVLDKFDVRKIYDMEVELFPIMYAMTGRGVRFDMEECRRLLRIQEKKKKAIEAQFDFNLNSTKKLGVYLYETLKLPCPGYTVKTRAYKTDKRALEHNADQPFVQKIIERSARNTLSKYLRSYVEAAVLEDDGWVIHANFNQIGPVTGRMSSSDPNLQNVAKRGDTVLRFGRRPFIPRDGYWWYAFDFDQIEARIFASEAGEKRMLKAFANGVDVYEVLAQDIRKHGVEITRDFAKGIFLGKLYGEKARKMSQQLRCDYQIAVRLIMAFDQISPRVSQFMHDTINEVKKKGFVTTRYGRRLCLDINSPYVATNHRIQGAAADLLKLALLRLNRYINLVPTDAHILMPIHDEIILEVGGAWKTNMNFIRGCRQVIENNEGLYTDVETTVSVSVIKKSWDKKEAVVVT